MPSTDQVLLYNVDPWNRLGFGVPNFGDNTHTVNGPARRLAAEISSTQLYLMRHVDAMRTQPPSRNTVERLGTLLNRINAVLSGRASEYNELRLEPGHTQPAPQPWTIHPAPYFPGPIVRNGWMAEFNELTMYALGNLYQHSDNALALTITAAMASDVWRYFREIQRVLGRELLNLPAATVEAADFQFTAEHFQAYAPDAVTVRREDTDRAVNPQILFTEDDLRPLTDGFPANLIVANLALYPVGADGSPTAQQVPPAGDAPSAPGVAGGTAVRDIL